MKAMNSNSDIMTNAQILANWFRLGFEKILNEYAEPSANPSKFYFNNKKVRFDFDLNSLDEL